MSDPMAPDSRGAARAEIVRQLVSGIVQARRAIAGYQALEMQMLAAVQALTEEEMASLPAASREREMPLRSLAAEIGAATRRSDRAVQRGLSDAASMTARLPAAVAAMARGEVDRAHLCVIHETAAGLPEGDVLAEFERAALAIAARESAGRMRSMLRILADRLHPEFAAHRRSEARTRRGVWVMEAEDGMAELRALLPAVIAAGIGDRVDRIARSILDAREGSAADTGGSRDATEGTAAGAADTGCDARSLAEVRADVLADLLLTGDPTATGRAHPATLAAIRAEVHVTIPVDALTGARPGSSAELAGHGPLDPETARTLAGHAAVWTRVFLHPTTGVVTAVDRYRPSPAQTRLLAVRDEHCRFPGCRVPTGRCDVDHTRDAALGGPTSIPNLAHLCRRHHSLKHHSAWTVRQRPDGTLRWTSPQGRTHDDRPPRTVVFRPDPDPPPF